jgi:hypothetical protein
MAQKDLGTGILCAVLSQLRIVRIRDQTIHIRVTISTEFCRAIRMLSDGACAQVATFYRGRDGRKHTCDQQTLNCQPKKPPAKGNMTTKVLAVVLCLVAAPAFARGDLKTAPVRLADREPHARRAMCS